MWATHTGVPGDVLEETSADGTCSAVRGEDSEAESGCFPAASGAGAKCHGACRVEGGEAHASIQDVPSDRACVARHPLVVQPLGASQHTPARRGFKTGAHDIGVQQHGEPPKDIFRPAGLNLGKRTTQEEGLTEVFLVERSARGRLCRAMAWRQGRAWRLSPRRTRTGRPGLAGQAASWGTKGPGSGGQGWCGRQPGQGDGDHKSTHRRRRLPICLCRGSPTVAQRECRRRVTLWTHNGCSMNRLCLCRDGRGW